MTDITYEQLSAYLDDALSAPEKTAVDNALAASSALRKELDALRRTRAIVRGMPAPRLPTGFEQRVLRAVNRPPASTTWLSFPPTLIGAAAAAVVMVLVMTEEGGLHFAAQARRAGWVAAAIPELDDVRRNPAALLPRPAALVFTAGVSAAQDRADTTGVDASIRESRRSVEFDLIQRSRTQGPVDKHLASTPRDSGEMIPLAKTLLESIPGAGLIHRIQTLAPSPLTPETTYSFARKKTEPRDLSLPLMAKANPDLVEKSFDDQRLSGMSRSGFPSTASSIRTPSVPFHSTEDKTALAYPPRGISPTSIKPTENKFFQNVPKSLPPTAMEQGNVSEGIGAGAPFDQDKELGRDNEFEVLADSSKAMGESPTVPRANSKAIKKESWGVTALTSKTAAPVDPSAEAPQAEFAGAESSRKARQVLGLSVRQDSGRSDVLPALEWAGDESGITAFRETTVRSETEWKALWSQHSSNKIGQTPAPSLDFHRSMVVGIFLGNRPSSGYGVRITDIQVAKETIMVTYKETKPNPDLIQLTVMTQPFHLRTLPRSDLPVRFKKK